MSRDKPEKVEVPNGTVSFYTKHDRYYADCNVHAKCRRFRTAKDGMPRRPGQGRPVGALLSWLADAASHDDAWGHRFLAPRFSVEDRLAARTALKVSGAAARLLMSHERARRPGEESEPDEAD